MSKKKRKKNKEKFLREQKKAEEKNKTSLIVIVSIVAAVLVAAFIFTIVNGNDKENNTANTGEFLEGSSGTDSEPETQMTPIAASVEGEYMAISLEDVEKGKLASFAYDDGSGNELPLLSYLTPSGKVITAVSVCEPCNSTTFHFGSDGLLTCNACYTKWDPETLEGISGGCKDYPPDELENTVEDGKILIKIDEITSWSPRV
ncbi:MAG: DUF2318 domain-containing protein [Actinomycetia bacterium]|nr:DUF2318 domain-containing protein [Actinomycetes bacterium]